MRRNSEKLPPTRAEREKTQYSLAARSILSLRLPQAKIDAARACAVEMGINVREWIEDLVDAALAKAGKGAGKGKK